MAKKHTDPLEAAKIGKEKSAKAPKAKADKEKKQEAPKAEAPKEEPKKADPPQAEDTKPEVPAAKAEKAAPKKAAAPAGVQRYRVVESCTFSRNGHVTRLKAGAIISSQHYGGAPGIEKLKAAGLRLEKVEG